MPRLLTRAQTLHQMLQSAASPEERAAIQARLDHADSAATDERHTLDGLIINNVDAGAANRAWRRALVAAAQERERRAR